MNGSRLPAPANAKPSVAADPPTKVRLDRELGICAPLEVVWSTDPFRRNLPGR